MEIQHWLIPVFHLHDALLSLDLCRCNFTEPSEQIVMIHRVNKCPNESDFSILFFFFSFRLYGTNVLAELEASFQLRCSSNYNLTIFWGRQSLNCHAILGSLRIQRVNPAVDFLESFSSHGRWKLRSLTLLSNNKSRVFSIRLKLSLYHRISDKIMYIQRLEYDITRLIKANFGLFNYKRCAKR